MPDMLVKLYDLPKPEASLEPLRQRGISLRSALAPEKQRVTQWVQAHFNAGWASEAEVCFARLPVSCWIATSADEILGFACYDAIKRGFFGPTGVSEDQRGQGIGQALLIACLHAQATIGYGYSIIGGVGPAAFYEKTVGARLIEGSDPGVYRGLLG